MATVTLSVWQICHTLGIYFSLTFHAGSTFGFTPYCWRLGLDFLSRGKKPAHHLMLNLVRFLLDDLNWRLKFCQCGVQCLLVLILILNLVASD